MDPFEPRPVPRDRRDPIRICGQIIGLLLGLSGVAVTVASLYLILTRHP